MITRHVDLGILSPHLVHFCCFASLITSIYIKNFTVLFVQKSFQTCDGASHVVTSNTLMMEQLSEVATVVTLYFIFQGCLWESEIADKRYNCTGFLCGSASCSRLQPSSTSPCPVMPQLTWQTTVSSSPTPMSDNCVLPTLEHSLFVGHAAVLETGPLWVPIWSTGIGQMAVTHFASFTACHEA